VRDGLQYLVFVILSEHGIERSKVVLKKNLLMTKQFLPIFLVISLAMISISKIVFRDLNVNWSARPFT
jgi:hypothetical protein